jgi:hypothetical protein
MELVGNALGLSKVLALNLNGLKYGPEVLFLEKDEEVNSYVAAIGSLGVSPNAVWRDDSSDFASFVQEAFEIMLSRGILRIERRKIIGCNCGRVEFLQGITLSRRRNIFLEAEGGRRICKVCRTELCETEMNICLFSVPIFTDPFLGIPLSAHDEFAAFARRFAGVDYLVSRSRQTQFVFHSKNSGQFGIDPDFVWSMMLPYLQRLGYAAKFVVGSRRTMLACFFIATLGRIFDCGDTTFLFPPFLLGPKGASVKTFGPTNKLIAHYGPAAVRAFLVSGLNWEVNESFVNPTYLEYLGSCNEEGVEEAIHLILPRNYNGITKMSGVNFRKAALALSTKTSEGGRKNE